jgi:hypothetical protein
MDAARRSRYTQVAMWPKELRGILSAVGMSIEELQRLL